MAKGKLRDTSTSLIYLIINTDTNIALPATIPVCPPLYLACSL